MSLIDEKLDEPMPQIAIIKKGPYSAFVDYRDLKMLNMESKIKVEQEEENAMIVEEEESQTSQMSVVEEDSIPSFPRYMKRPECIPRKLNLPRSHFMVDQGQQTDPLNDDEDKPTLIQICQKVDMPVNALPNCDFTEMLYVSKAPFLRELETKMRCKIEVKGRGSLRDPLKEEQLLWSGNLAHAHLNKVMHLEINLMGEPKDAFTRIWNTVMAIRKFIIPDALITKLAPDPMTCFVKRLHVNKRQYHNYKEPCVILKPSEMPRTSCASTITTTTRWQTLHVEMKESQNMIDAENARRSAYQHYPMRKLNKTNKSNAANRITRGNMWCRSNTSNPSNRWSLTNFEIDRDIKWKFMNINTSSSTINNMITTTAPSMPRRSQLEATFKSKNPIKMPIRTTSHVQKITIPSYFEDRDFPRRAVLPGGMRPVQIAVL